MFLSKTVRMFILGGLLVPMAAMPMQQGLTKGQKAQKETQNYYMKWAAGFSIGAGLYANVLHLVSKAGGNDDFKIRNFQDWLGLTLVYMFCGGVMGIATASVHVISDREVAFNNAIKTDALDDCFGLRGVINTYPSNNNGKTALMAAAEAGAEEIFYALMKEGAKPTRAEYGALGKACENKSNAQEVKELRKQLAGVKFGSNASQGSAAYHSVLTSKK